ncbi:MAG: SDR family oxidoreductase [Kangiellaceae bacterium]|nr:SDR family oxidoreductase [Kangiellaceae bacterium]
MENHNSSVVLITGANRGIGLALCKVYKSRRAQVIGVCRQTSEALNQLDIEIIDSVDVTQKHGIDHLKNTLNDRPIDILINNAGILRSQSLNSLDFDEMMEQFQVNTIGPMRVVDGLRESLSAGAKIAMITSRMGSIEDNTSGGQYGYRMSKCALNAASKSLALDLKEKGIAVAILHPGYVQTEMVNFGGDISSDLSAERLAARVDELDLDNTGSFWHSNGELLPW